MGDFVTLFEQLKILPKVDMHINLTSSISTDLASFLMDDENLVDVIDMMQEKNLKDYENSLKLPIKILRKKENITLAINDLIDRLIKNNIFYGELFLDLPLYNKRIDEEKLLLNVLEVIKERNFDLQVVLVLSSERDKELNLQTLDLYEKYYQKGVNGIYFHKDKMASVSSYMYLFDRLIKNNYPYIVKVDSKISREDNEIYLHAKRIIYSLPYIDELFLNSLRKAGIMIEIGLTRFKENNLFPDFKDYFIYDLISENTCLTLVSYDMTALNTDIVNEWCLMFNNYPITIHDMIKIINNSIIMANISNEEKEKLILELKEKSNLVL